MQPKAPPLVLHIGPLKTGTSYLQAAMASLRPEFRKAGWLYPLNSDHMSQERALSGILGVRIPWVSEKVARNRSAAGQALLAEMNDWDGPLMVSAEALAALTSESAQWMFEQLPQRPVHVVITARDLGRAIPSHAAELYKAGRAQALSSIVDRLSKEREEVDESSFWRMYHYPRLVERWRALPAVESVHVVTLPPPGAPQTELWSRFTQATGFTDPALTATPVVQKSLANVSPSAAECRMLRAVALEMYRLEAQRQEVHDLFTSILDESIRTEGTVKRGRSMQVPPAWAERVASWGADDNAALTALGVDIIGDISDLRPVVPAPDAEPADDSAPSSSSLEEPTLAAAAAAIAAIYRMRVAEAATATSAANSSDTDTKGSAALGERLVGKVRRTAKAAQSRVQSRQAE